MQKKISAQEGRSTASSKRPVAQSVSRVARCTDNGPMEGFGGILKHERYYGRRFTDKQELIPMIEGHIRRCSTRRVQRSPGILTPMEKHELYLALHKKRPAAYAASREKSYSFSLSS